MPTPTADDEQPLADFLAAEKLTHLTARLEEEEFTKSVLMQMAKEEADFCVQLGELKIGLRDAMALKLALLRCVVWSDTDDDDDGPPPSGKRAVSPPAVDVSDASSSAPALLVGERVQISGLSSRTDLNGAYGKALSYDAASGRYTIAVEGPLGEDCTFNLKLDNLTKAPPAAPPPAPPPKFSTAKPTPIRQPAAPGATAASSVSPPASTSRPAGSDAMASDPRKGSSTTGVAATMAAAAAAPPMVTKWTPNGPRLVPATHAKSNAQVMAALHAMGQANAAQAQQTALAAATAAVAVGAPAAPAPPAEPPSAEVDDDDDYVHVGHNGTPAEDMAAAPQPPPPPQQQEQAAAAATPPSDPLAAALASVAALDTAADGVKGAVVAANEGPRKPVVKSFTQINHVADDKAHTGPSSVDRGTANKALAAYKRRGVYDPNAGVDAYEIDTGVGGTDEAERASQERLKRDEERLASGNASYTGRHFNAI